MLQDVEIPRCLDGVVNALAQVGAFRVDPASIDASTSLRDLAHGGLCRANLFHSLVRFGRGAPEQLVRSVKTVGEACEWIDIRWDGAVPADLAAATSDLVYGPRIGLRPVLDSDLQAIYVAATHPESSFRWRFKGQTPSPEEVLQTTWRGVHAQYVIHRHGSLDPIGLVIAYQASPGNGTVYVAFQRLAPQPAIGEMFEGMFFFFEHLFRTWGFRKLYVEVPGYNLPTVYGGDQTLFTEEGRLVRHERFDDQWWDLEIGALWRERWDEFAAQWRTWYGRLGS